MDGWRSPHASSDASRVALNLSLKLPTTVAPTLEVRARGQVTGRETQDAFPAGPGNGFTPARNMTSRDHLLWQTHLLQESLVSRISLDLPKRRIAFNNY
jgi:hypothetical protein